MGKRVLWLGVLMLSVSACTLFSGGPVRDTSRVRDLFIEFTANRSRVNVGEAIEFRLTVTNQGNSETIVELKDHSVLDIIVSISLGSEYLTYRWSDGKEITPEMTRLVLAPGESKTLEWTWIAAEEGRGAFIRAGGRVQYTESDYQGAGVRICVDGCGYY